MAGLVLGLAYAAINLSLATSLWAAAGGALAIAAFLTLERMAVRPDPVALTEQRWQGPRPHRVIVLPAYRAAKTLAEVVGDIPKGHADRILLVDDASADATVSVATALNLDVIRHTRNLGYGGNQKTCYRRALQMGADVPGGPACSARLRSPSRSCCFSSRFCSSPGVHGVPWPDSRGLCWRWHSCPSQASV